MTLAIGIIQGELVNECACAIRDPPIRLLESMWLGVIHLETISGVMNNEISLPSSPYFLF